MKENYLGLIKEGVQPREAKFNIGENQRVWEADCQGIKIGINVGDITSAPTEAIMCPTTPWLGIGGGAIENKIASVTKNELFGKYTNKIIELLNQIRNDNSDISLNASIKFSQFLEKNTGIKNNKKPEQIREDIIQLTKIDKFKTDNSKNIALSYGMSIPAPAGKNLGEKGIKIVVLTNVTPEGKTMSIKDMSLFTKSAVTAVNQSNADSITIPAVGTGFAAAFGFGLSLADSITGFLKGSIDYIQENGNNNCLKRIDYNIYCSPTAENALEISRQMNSFIEKV